jgi:hypothetical protein
MNRQRNWPIALVCFMFSFGVTTAQERKDNRSDVLVQMEILDLQNGLPGTGSKSTSPVGGLFGVDTTREKDPSGKQLYFRTIDGRSRWVQNNGIEVTLEIDENGTKRTETVRLNDFEPKTLVLREDRALGRRELLRLIPVWDPKTVLSSTAK